MVKPSDNMIKPSTYLGDLQNLTANNTSVTIWDKLIEKLQIFLNIKTENDEKKMLFHLFSENDKENQEIQNEIIELVGSLQELFDNSIVAVEKFTASDTVQNFKKFYEERKPQSFDINNFDYILKYEEKLESINKKIETLEKDIKTQDVNYVIYSYRDLKASIDELTRLEKEIYETPDRHASPDELTAVKEHMKRNDKHLKDLIDETLIPTSNTNSIVNNLTNSISSIKNVYLRLECICNEVQKAIEGTTKINKEDKTQLQERLEKEKTALENNYPHLCTRTQPGVFSYGTLINECKQFAEEVKKSREI